MNSKIGKGNASENFLNSSIELDKISEIIFLSYQKYNSGIEHDKYEKEFLEELSQRKIPFKIDNHVASFIYNNKDNSIKIIKYLLFRYKFYLAGKRKINLGYPPYVLIEPISACNLRCPFCFQSDKTFTKSPFMGVMKLDLFKKIVDDCDSIGVGAITMASRGEPGMNKNLDKMLDYVGLKKNIFEIKLNTNATLLTENLIHSIFRNKLTNVVISADHYIKEDFERLRLGSKFEEVVKNVDRLFEIRKKKYPESKTEIRVSGIDNDKNIDKQKYVDFWAIRSDNVSIGLPLERWDTYNNNIQPNLTSPCENLWDRMYVWYDGKVNPCDSDYKSYLTYGNLKKSSIKELWNNTISEKIRIDHLNLDRNKINPCDRCGINHEQ
jgi:radical SAM protein with 4Fe4S-binding SPASM domain